MFTTFSKAVHANFTKMSKNELFVVQTEDFFAKYLATFPEGENPVFRKRTVYDCVCCKQFVRRLGSLVNIVDGKVVTVWDNLDKLPHPFNAVASKMAEIVRNCRVMTVFRTKEKKFSVDHNFDKATNERHNHFYGEVAARHYSLTPDTLRGQQDGIFQVMKRGLNEIQLGHIDDVLDLIDSNGLYTGDTHKTAILEYKELLTKFIASGKSDLFVWENLSNPYARLRNTVIGSLFTDLVEGKELEHAVKSFEVKVAPANYKRPTAIITQKMMENAQQTLTDLGIGAAIYRRYARLSDVSVNDVLWVDNEAKSKMKGGIADIIGSSVKKSVPDVSKAITITSEAFLKDVVPTATSMEVFLENRHTGNFVSLTGSDCPERLFKWNNQFAWSYDGDMADSELRRKVQSLGGRVDGVLRFSHQWNYDKRNASLMDLHVFMPGSSAHKDGVHNTYPSGQRVGWNNRKDYVSGGVQDVDYTAAAPVGYAPVENITFPSMDKLKEGKYVFKIHNWSLRRPTQGGFKAEIEFGGQVFAYEMVKPLKNHEWVTVATATLKNGLFTIEHAMDSSKTSQEKWGVKTETLVSVATILNSPNHWEGQSVGAKHLIFALKECKNPDQTRGIYNEFLRGDLEKHRKVFEVLGSKTKCKPADEQVSGVGFTKARGDTVTVVVNGRKSYTVTF